MIKVGSLKESPGPWVPSANGVYRPRGPLAWGSTGLGVLDKVGSLNGSPSLGGPLAWAVLWPRGSSGLGVPNKVESLNGSPGLGSPPAWGGPPAQGGGG